jgi:hypothetical protein
MARGRATPQARRGKRPDSVQIAACVMQEIHILTDN